MESTKKIKPNLYGSQLSYKPCKNHYKKSTSGTFQRVGSCGEQLPFCCQESSPASGYCRRTENQCSETGIEAKPRQRDFISTSTYDPSSYDTQELSDDARKYMNYLGEQRGYKKRMEFMKHYKRNSVCSQQVLDYFGPFVVSETEAFFIHDLKIDESYIRGVSQNSLCKALNATFEKYNELIERKPELKDEVSPYEFVKRYAFDTLFEILKKNIQN